MEVVPASGAAAITDVSSSHSDLMTAGPTTNTMNVHNANQQVVMQISNVNKLHLGSVFNFNNNVSATNSLKGNADADEQHITGNRDTTANGSKRQIPRKTTTIVAMMQSQDEPSTRMLDTIATHLGEGWKQVMRDLGHSEGQIEQAIIDHNIHGGIREVIHQLLLQWLRNADDHVGTLGHITTLLWEGNQRGVVERMKIVFKMETKSK